MMLLAELLWGLSVFTEKVNNVVRLREFWQELWRAAYRESSFTKFLSEFKKSLKELPDFSKSKVLKYSTFGGINNYCESI